MLGPHSSQGLAKLTLPTVNVTPLYNTDPGRVSVAGAIGVDVTASLR